MTLNVNDQVEALILKNAVIKPVNITTFKNPFLLLSTTRALNELVSNTAPSDRARQQGIEDDKAYLKTPSGARSDRKAPKKDEKQDTQPIPPKRKATPKPATSSGKTATTAAAAPAPAPAPRGRKNDPAGVKDMKALARDATAKAIKDAGKGVVKVAKAAKAKADKTATAKKNAELKAVTAAAKAETARIKKQMENRKEGQTIPLGDVKLRGGNSSDRRLGTKTQKKKK